MATGLPSQTQVIELLDAEFTRAGYEIDDVVIDARARPPRITVIADGDTALDLDTAAALSRSAAALLDEAAPAAGAYHLEVSSPGVDRPLTAAKHFRRARGRKAEVTLSDHSVLTGRVGATHADGFDLVVKTGKADWSVRRIPLAQVQQAIVQIEFAAPARRELELAGVSDPAGNVDTEEAGA
ncbi:ribosome maturation factor RimP [Mycobacterium koreense]|uniref:Ribosome maturation factor RimP n=1 Tax=Mycolicibacillus koreensis TaxID=1069220 RepID=A0A7I7SDC7_9MYCO|nr:ribosome maturation factor RimP [Mycolicibacillus koreensis]MCV7246763.1 ribosome maturation factor RimP [Mycolicibacillus koreensis]OSC32195.1 ribosome maturation factor RimP [Mycolicibacillus koreensis]BBY54371.1 ribosome maturation factor RimP [Mycolicibacillus koreensis]